MNDAYGDNYWTEQGQNGVAGGGNAYADSGMNNNPSWANEPDPEQQDIRTEAPPKKSSYKPQKAQTSNKSSGKSFCTCSERLKKYAGLWSCFFVMAFVGILLLIAKNSGVSTPGLLIFFIGFIGFSCSWYSFCKYRPTN